jgi:putative copper export protein
MNAMSAILRTLRLLAIVVWVGGLIFFAFVEAPTAFRVMGTNGQFALLIGGSLDTLNMFGTTCGFVFLLATIGLWFRTDPRARRLLLVETLLIILMITATQTVQRSIVPRMESDRAAAGGDINSVPKDNAARVDFDRRHELSEKVEGSALFLGLGVVLVMAAEDSRRLPPGATR